MRHVFVTILAGAFQMPINPNVPAASLLSVDSEISPVEYQNRFGTRYCTISDLPAGGFLTILAIQTPNEFSAEQFFSILTYLQSNYGVELMQTAFAATIPQFGEQYRNDLHLSAHLRAEQQSFGSPVSDTE
ncbi:MAG: hypothetical protein ACRCUY_04885 [Thermoguttaceae bacterium]